MLKNDSTISRIREIRRDISEACEYDPKKLIEYYMKLQKKHQKRLITQMDIEKEDMIG